MNILIIHTAFIGDIVLSTALVSKVKEKYPDSDIYYLTTSLGKEILKNNPKIKEIIVYDKRGKDKGFGAFISFVRKIGIGIILFKLIAPNSPSLIFIKSSLSFIILCLGLGEAKGAK